MRGGSTHTSHALSAKCHSVDMESDYVSRQLSRVWIRFYACKLIRLSLRSKIQCILTIRNCRISFEIGSARSATKSPFRFVPSVCYTTVPSLFSTRSLLTPVVQFGGYSTTTVHYHESAVLDRNAVCVHTALIEPKLSLVFHRLQVQLMK